MKNGISIINDTGMGFGTKVIDTLTGQEIKGIKSIIINKITPQEPIIGILEVFIDNIHLKYVEVEVEEKEV